MRPAASCADRLELQILDDKRVPDRAIANVKGALANPHTVAMIGLTAADRANAAFDAVGWRHWRQRHPVPVGYQPSTASSRSRANVFTMRPSQDDERVPVMAEFIKARNIQRPAFVGLKGQLVQLEPGRWSEVGLVTGRASSPTIGWPCRTTSSIRRRSPRWSPTSSKRTPIWCSSPLARARTPAVLAAFVAAGLTPPLFVTGRIETILEAGAAEYPGDIFQLAWENLPDVFSDRLRERIVRNGLERWVFEGAKVPEAPGWKSGECKPRPENVVPDVFDSRNMLAIGRGTQYADMVALVAEALKTADPRANTSSTAGPPADPTQDYLCRRARRLPRQLRELVVQGGLARRRSHPVHSHAS